jgi:molybdopterin molybdotransferase
VVLSTGDEVAPLGAPRRPGQVPDSNAVLVAARLAELGAEVVSVVHVGDEDPDVRDGFARALDVADLVVSSGGVSVGPRDPVKPALRALGVRELLWRMATQPGRPVWAGVRERSLVLALPGNPLSVLVGLELLVRPAIATLLGRPGPTPPFEPASLAHDVPRLAARTRVLPAHLAGGVARLAGALASHQSARSLAADALVVVPPGEDTAPAGARVAALRLSVP